jgi:hypothetical protein
MPLDVHGNYVGPRYLRVAETAKLVRAELKKGFPGVKFSVRSHSYSGGASIRVSWTDGPPTKSVDRVVGRFAGSRFDGMTDLKYGANHWLCPEHGPRTASIYGNSYDSESVGVGVGNGPVDSRCCAKAELVSFGSDYVFTSRELSPEFRARVAAGLKEKFGIEYQLASGLANSYDDDREFHKLASVTEG